MNFAHFLHQAAIILIYIIGRLKFLAEVHRVLCKVGSIYLYILKIQFIVVFMHGDRLSSEISVFSCH